MLAAFDLARALSGIGGHLDEAAKITCYTFGCPRTGNHAFAKLFNGIVKDTWHVINDQVCQIFCLKAMLSGLHHPPRIVGLLTIIGAKCNAQPLSGLWSMVLTK